MREIQLTQGKVAIVDDADYEFLAQFKWCHARGYAVRSFTRDGITKAIYMHNDVLRPREGFVCDHINRNGLDNRRCNLREATLSQNSANKVFPRRPSKAGFRGVSHVINGHFQPSGKFAAHINKNKKTVCLGASFVTAEAAARAYDAAAKEIFGEFAILNFPQD